MRKKLISIFMSVCMLLVMSGFSTALAASPNVGVSEVIPANPFGNSGGITVNSVYLPDKDSLYTNDIQNTISGSAEISALYTNKCFNGIVRLKYRIVNNSSSVLVVQLRRYALIGHWEVTSITVNPGTVAVGTLEGLESDKTYFMAFSAPSNFEGWIMGCTS